MRNVKTAAKKNHFAGKAALNNVRRLVEFLSGKKTSISPLLILTHDYPDPDALAGACALKYLAEKIYGINAQVVYGGIIGRAENRGMVDILRMPVRKLRPGDLRKYAHVALVDTQPAFENNAFPDKRKATVVIDQHPSVTPPSADLAIVDTKCGATCAILAQTLLHLGVDIPDKIATALAYGIMTDTQNLYRVRRKDVIKIYLNILAHCDLQALARLQSPVRNEKFFIKLSEGISRSRICRGLIIAHLGAVNSPDLVAEFADFFLTYKYARWSFCTGRYRERLYASLRTVRMEEPAAGILRDVFPHPKDAGGHDTVAGGSVWIGKGVGGTVRAESEQILIKRLVKRLHIPAGAEFRYPFREGPRKRPKGRP